MSDEVLVRLPVCSEVQMIANSPADATATPIISCFMKIQIGLTFLVPAYPGCLGKVAIKRVLSWPPISVADADITFLPYGFYLSIILFFLA